MKLPESGPVVPTAYAVVATGGLADVGAAADAGALVDVDAETIDDSLPDPATGVRRRPPDRRTNNAGRFAHNRGRAPAARQS